MQADTPAVLDDLKAKRELRGPANHMKDYWRTYGLLALYGLAYAFLDFKADGRVEGLFLYVTAIVIVATAVTDSQRALNRRFAILVELLEKKGSL